MEKYYYSNETKGFYTSSIHGKNKPSDCIELSYENYLKLLNKPLNTYIDVANNKLSIKEVVLSKDDLLKIVKDKIVFKSDILSKKLLHNESYSYDASYSTYKEEIISSLKLTREQLKDLELKNIDELKVLMKEV